MMDPQDKHTIELIHVLSTIKTIEKNILYSLQNSIKLKSKTKLNHPIRNK